MLRVTGAEAPGAWVEVAGEAGVVAACGAQATSMAITMMEKTTLSVRFLYILLLQLEGLFQMICNQSW
jgi:hypothetical protein